MARIAFLTPQLPHPAISGGVIKSRKLIEHLGARHELHLFSLLKGEDERHVAEFRSKVPLASFHGVPVNVPRTASNFLRSIGAGVPLSVYRNRSASMRAAVQRFLRETDIAFVDHFLMFQYLPRGFAGRVVLHQHNAEYMLWHRYAAVEKNPVRRMAVRAESRRIRRYERRIGLRSHAVLAAPNDIEALATAGIPRGRFTQTLHLGDDTLLQFSDVIFAETDPCLLCVGSLDWEANRDGLLWFLREVWPKLSASRPGLRLRVIGRNPGPELSRMLSSSAGAEWLGFVEDLEPHYRRARVFIAPLRFGSGIKVKVVNALYRGVPVVTTTIGAEGLRVRSGEELFIADDTCQTIRSIESLLTREDIWTRMRDAARSVARQHYTWEASLKAMDGVLEV